MSYPCVYNLSFPPLVAIMMFPPLLMDVFSPTTHQQLLMTMWSSARVVVVICRALDATLVFYEPQMCQRCFADMGRLWRWVTDVLRFHALRDVLAIRGLGCDVNDNLRFWFVALIANSQPALPLFGVCVCMYVCMYVQKDATGTTRQVAFVPALLVPELTVDLLLSLLF